MYNRTQRAYHQILPCLQSHHPQFLARHIYVLTAGTSPSWVALASLYSLTPAATFCKLTVERSLKTSSPTHLSLFLTLRVSPPPCFSPPHFLPPKPAFLRASVSSIFLCAFDDFAMMTSKLGVFLTLLALCTPQTRSFGWRADKREPIGKKLQTQRLACESATDVKVLQQAQDLQRPYKNNHGAISTPLPSQNFKNSSPNHSATGSLLAC